MYQMRAIRLLEKKGLCSVLEARALVMNTPKEIKCDDEICEITQIFPTHDGPYYQVLCRFAREKGSEITELSFIVP